MKPKLGQRFVVDVELFVALLEASHTDELTDTVCYADVVRATLSTFASQNYQLLAQLAQLEAGFDYFSRFCAT